MPSLPTKPMRLLPGLPGLPRLLVAVALGVAASAAIADYPDRPVRLVVPFPPGGNTDVAARLVAQGLGDRLGQNVVIDYKAGAATIIGADAVSKARPDGYTLLFGTATTYVFNPVVYRSLPYNPRTSFDPIGIIGGNGMVLLANKDVPAANLSELLALARSKPGQLSYASHGTGTPVHFVAEMLWKAANVDVLHVPYKGGAPALADVMGGQVQMVFDGTAAASAALKGDRVKALAVTGARREALLPNVPTIAESGFPGFELSSWYAVVAPRGLPRDVHERLQKALKATVEDPAVRDKLTAQGFDVRFSGPEAYAKAVNEGIAKLTPLADAASIRQEGP